MLSPSERRHLTSSQKAVLSLEMLPALEEEARERKRQHGGTAPGRSKNTGGTNSTSEDEDVVGKSRDEAATITGSNPRYISDAKRLAQEAPELLEKVRVGELSWTTTIPSLSKLLPIMYPKRLTIMGPIAR